MRRRHLTPAPLLALVLAGCAGTDEVALDEPTTSEAPPPDEPADDGFAPRDYDYTLSTGCFCPYGGVPVRVSVRGDVVVSAVFARSGGRGGAVRGEAAPESASLSIEDLLARAEEAEAAGAAEVRVTWPTGTEHPTEIWIDRDERTLDEELGWTISEVDVLG